MNIIFQLSSNLTANELKAYGKAGAVAEEVLSSIRTVFSYNGQTREQKRFDKNLESKNIFDSYRYERHLGEARKSGIKKGAVSGVAIGLLWFLVYCEYALGISFYILFVSL